MARILRQITIETTDGAKLGLRKRPLQKMKAEAMYDIADFWHRLFSAFHFTNEGARRYHYKARKTKNIYSGEVRKFKRQNRSPTGLPLVWTGLSRARAKVYRVKATFRRSQTISTIPTFNFRPNGIDMRGEYTTVVPHEVRKLEKIAETRLIRRLNKSNVRVVIRVGTS